LVKGQGLQDDPLRGGSFTKSNIDGIQSQTIYDFFWSPLETSPHNSGHIIVGAGNSHMGNGMSPLDPIFWLHHCNIDRLWAQWQAAGNTTPPLSSTYDSQFVDANKQPVMATSTNALNIADFNYTYDVLAGPAVARESHDLGLESFRNQKTLSPENISSAPQRLGVTTEAKTVKTNFETAFSVAVAELVPNLFRSRTFWAPRVLGVQRLAAEPSRLLARLTIVSAPQEAAPIMVNVFVNHPNLSPETDSNDPHYAGSFCFFGPHQNEFIVDITEPLRALSVDGRIATNDVTIQLIPIAVDPNVTAETTFTVGKVEVLRV
jgi:tyrosinase